MPDLMIRSHSPDELTFAYRRIRDLEADLDDERKRVVYQARRLEKLEAEIAALVARITISESVRFGIERD